jgi:threonine dehydrogenase-like Zn-dependent dehydrogenase
MLGSVPTFAEGTARQMRALVIEAAGRIALAERETRMPGDTEALVRVIATGICGSDIHGLAGHTGRRVVGQVMGHETVGRVAQVGAAVPEDLVGALVAINPVISCETCPDCLAGREEICDNGSWVLGVRADVDAAFAEYVTVPQGALVVLPEGTIEQHGALVEPLAVGFHALMRGAPTPDDRVLVLGAGPIGQAVAIAAGRAGVDRVMVSEPDPARRRLIDALGFAAVAPEELESSFVSRFGGPPTLVVDAVGSRGTFISAIDFSAPGARIVLVGMASPELEVPAYSLSAGERTVIGSFCYSRRHFSDTARWVAENPDTVALLFDGTYPLERGPEIFDRLVAETLTPGKVLLTPGTDADPAS